jgi:hypothetical protein
MMNDKVDLSIRQFVEAWRVMCSAAPGYATRSGPGVECVFSGSPIPFFNVAVLTGRNISAESIRISAESARTWSADRAVPWIFATTREALAPGTDIAAVLDSCGFAPFLDLTGMLAEQVAPPTRPIDGLEFRVPQTDSECQAILEVNSAAYGMSLAAGNSVWGKRAFWADHFPVVGSIAGQPVSCSAVYMVDGHRYVAMVATTPAHQRNGYAEATMRRALELAGDHPTFLHATDAGRPIYARMGYQTVASHPVFIDKAFLAGH